MSVLVTPSVSHRAVLNPGKSSAHFQSPFLVVVESSDKIVGGLAGILLPWVLGSREVPGEGGGSVALQPWSSPGEIRNASRMEHKEMLKKEADGSWLAGGRLNKQGNARTRLVLGGCQRTRSWHMRARISRVSEEALMGFSRAYSPEGLSNTLCSQGCL